MEHKLVELKFLNPEESEKLSTWLLTELKANMRFWFRAFNVMEPKILWEIEGILFGNSEKNKSPIGLKLREKVNNGIVKLEVILNRYINEKSIEEMRKKINNNKLVDEVLGIVSGVERGDEKSTGLEWYLDMLELSLILGGVGKGIRRNEGVVLYEVDKQNADISEKIKKLIKQITIKTEIDTKNMVEGIFDELEYEDDHNHKNIKDIQLKKVNEIYKKSSNKKFSYSYCKGICIYQKHKMPENYKSVKGVKSRGKERIKYEIYDNTFDKVIEYRKFPYTYYKGTRSKLYADRKIQTPVICTSYQYNSNDYYVLVILNNTNPKRWKGGR